jgi:hypothetical protein
MAGFDWRKIVGTVAPTIATALGGPLAGLAVKAIGGALGLGDGASDADVEARLAGATPADLLALKKADQAFATEMRRLEVDLDRISAADRDSARHMQVETRSWAPPVLAAVVVGGFITASVAVLGGWVDGLKDPLIAALVGSVIGNITAATMLVLNFYFGTTSSSRAKDDTIRALGTR